MKDESTTGRWQRRRVLVALCFVACFVAYTDRVNISVAAVAMKEQLGWSQTEKGFVLSSFFIGYMLRKAKRNFFIGIRTPWTLSSDTVWDKTHQIGAVLFMVSGVLAVIGGLVGGMTAFWMLFIPLISSTLFLVAYSYVLYRNETRA